MCNALFNVRPESASVSVAPARSHAFVWVALGTLERQPLVCMQCVRFAYRYQTAEEHLATALKIRAAILAHK